MRNAKSRRGNQILAAAVGAAGVMGFAASTEAGIVTWKNTGTSFTTTGNWNGGTPGTGDTGFFDSAVANTQTATLDGSASIGGLRFGLSSGTTTLSATLTSNSSSYVLTLNSVGTGTSSALALGNAGGAVAQNATVYANLALIAANQTFHSFPGSGTLTISGVISGGNASNTLTLTGEGTRLIVITGTVNSFASQPVIAPTRVLAGNLGNADNNGSLGTYGTLKFSGGSLGYTGQGETTDRKLDIFNGGTISNENTTVGNTLTLAGAVSSTAATGTTKRLTLTPTGTSTIDVTGLISNGVTGATLNVHVLQGNVVKLSNTANSYGGSTSIRGATLEVAKIGNSGNPSSLGTGNLIKFGETASVSGTLRYVGNGETSDKVITFSGIAGTAVTTLDASGGTTVSSPLIFTQNLSITGNTGANNLGFGGTGAGEFQGVIANSALTGTTSNTSVTKSGISTWKLTAVNT